MSDLQNQHRESVYFQSQSVLFFSLFFSIIFFFLVKTKFMQDFNFADQSNFVNSCTLQHARDVTCFVFATMRVQGFAHFCPFLLTVHVVVDR